MNLAGATREQRRRGETGSRMHTFHASSLLARPAGVGVKA